jgi:hypothetical protein
MWRLRLPVRPEPGGAPPTEGVGEEPLQFRSSGTGGHEGRTDDEGRAVTETGLLPGGSISFSVSSVHRQSVLNECQDETRTAPRVGALDSPSSASAPGPSMTDKTYYQRHREERLKYSRKYRQEHREEIRAYRCGEQYRATHREWQARHLKKLRSDVLRHYSPEMKCVKCGFPDERALVIDHVAGNARRSQNRRNCGYPFYVELRDQGYPEGYQVLCANCNMIKQKENREWGAGRPKAK